MRKINDQLNLNLDLSRLQMLLDNNRQKFLRFHRKNPDVYLSLRELALQIRNTGRLKWSINSLFEVLRWQSALETKDDNFKLNNNYRAFYARLLMQNEPVLKNFFEVRKQTSETETEGGDYGDQANNF